MVGTMAGTSTAITGIITGTAIIMAIIIMGRASLSVDGDAA